MHKMNTKLISFKNYIINSHNSKIKVKLINKTKTNLNIYIIKKVCI